MGLENNIKVCKYVKYGTVTHKSIIKDATLTSVNVSMSKKAAVSSIATLHYGCSRLDKGCHDYCRDKVVE